MSNDIFEINGGRPLYGEIRNQTSKNATLPIMSASILAEGETVLFDIPDITDVHNMIKILERQGSIITINDNILTINTSNMEYTDINKELAYTMRSSLFLLGSTLARFKSMKLYMPGGCDIGHRPIDIHLSAFKKLGVDIIEDGDAVIFNSINAHSGKVRLRIPSVGATENIIEFASTLKGKTTILNPAKEPEIIDLANFLNKMGAKILGAGTDKITIYGVDKLRPTTYVPTGDRIVSGTIMSAVACCGGDVEITNACPYENKKIIEILCSLGCQIDVKNDIIHISRDKPLVSNQQISTDYYPGFPTDMQSMLVVIATVALGEMTIKENIFENRFLIVDELAKMGADICKVSNRVVRVNGVDELNGADLFAKDLRGGASLVLAGLMSNGTTRVHNVHFIDRGYDGLDKMLKKLGADIKRL